MATSVKTTTFTRTSKTGEVRRVLDLVRDRKLQVVDVKFCDLPGTWQHFSIPASALDEEHVPARGSASTGRPSAASRRSTRATCSCCRTSRRAFVDPVLAVPTLSLTCDIYDPITLEPYSRDPRFIAFKAEEYLKTTGIATTSYWGPEAEFFIFNSVRFDQNAHEGYYHIDSEEGIWNSGRNGTPEPGAPAPAQGGLLPGAAGGPAAGRAVEDHARADRGGDPGRGAAPRGGDRGPGGDRHPVRHAGADRRPADDLQVHRQERLPSTWATRPRSCPSRSSATTARACTAHQSLWKGDKPLFFDENGYALLSEMARHYIGGLIAHAPALLALCAPTTNSYRRLVPGFEAPVNLMYSARNRSAICRIPMYSSSPKAQAGGVPGPGPDRQPVPRVRGDADGRARRHQAQARAARADRRGPLRAARRAEGEHQDGAGLAGRGGRPRWSTTTSSCSRATSSRPTCWRPGSR